MCAKCTPWFLSKPIRSIMHMKANEQWVRVCCCLCTACGDLILYTQYISNRKSFPLFFSCIKSKQMSIKESMHLSLEKKKKKNSYLKLWWEMHFLHLHPVLWPSFQSEIVLFRQNMTQLICASVAHINFDWFQLFMYELWADSLDYCSFRAVCNNSINGLILFFFISVAHTLFVLCFFWVCNHFWRDSNNYKRVDNEKW